MLTSFAYIILFGMLFGWVFRKMKLPGLLGMLLTGILLGPYVLNWLDESVLGISSDLRQLALVIILMRAGLALDIKDLRKVGRPAILMCFVPACFEIVGIVLVAPWVLGISILDAAIMGTVVAAVSPAVIVPRMLYLIEHGYGTKESIPQLVMAGASVDDVFVIVLFTAFTGLAQGTAVSVGSLTGIPVAIVLGLAAGILIGQVMIGFFQKVHIRDSGKVLVLLSISFLLIAVEQRWKAVVPFSGLLAVMGMGTSLQRGSKAAAGRLSVKFSKLWVGAEVFLFVLVGATVDLQYAVSAGALAALVIVAGLLFRMVGVSCCLWKTGFTPKERLFCMVAYMPKATVQAAIGALPLSMGLSCGNIVLTTAVLSILMTAPAGAFLIDKIYEKCLTKDQVAS